MNIEKLLLNYLRGKIHTVDKQAILEASFGDGNKTLNVFFNLARDEINNVSDSVNLDRLVQMLRWTEIILNNKSEINHKIVERKVNQLFKLMDTIMHERSKHFNCPKKIESEFSKVRKQLDIILDNNQTDTKSYKMMAKLVNEIRNLDYLECILKGVPSMTNVKNKEGIPIIQTILRKFIQAGEKEELEDFDYYEKALILVLAQDSFDLTDTIKKKCLDMLNQSISNIRSNKKKAKKMKRTLDDLMTMYNRIKNHGVKENSIDILADKYKIHVFFDEDLIEKAKLVKEEKEGQMSNREVVNDYMVSIDASCTKEIDDTLSCKKLPNGHYLLGVHCASPLSYYSYESDIVQEAIFRNHSIYLSKVYQKKENDYYKTIPIFPYSFSTDIGSLKEGEPRRTRSYFFEIDEDGNIVDERLFVRTIVTNSKRLSYEEANDILINGTNDKKLQELMNNLDSVTRLLGRKYHEDLLYESIKENTEDDSLLRTKRSGSENIVFRAALLTGNRVGEFLYRNGFPCPYRVHQVDEEQREQVQEMLEEIKKVYGDENLNRIYQIIESLYPKARYGLSGRHDGLDIEHMVQCTSELRRGMDIVVEHIAEVCVDKTPTDEELVELEMDVAKKILLLNSQGPYIDSFVKEYKRKGIRI